MEPGPSALVVDDDRALRLLCRVNLELEGFSVREAGTVAEAAAALDEAAPSVVLLDAHLGREGVDGLLERLRRDGVPVVVVTGSVDLDDYRGRADEVLGKPFRPENLVAVARRLARVGP
ncbi:MAG TPA: response regulator [Gaiellaceae bacterium]|jgi:DNA-binding response OmpR family regulator